MRVIFDEVSLHGEKTVKCAGCGKRIKRRKKFWQTLNPFNRHPDGLPKTQEDIMAELQQEREEWQRQPELCSRCQGH